MKDIHETNRAVHLRIEAWVRIHERMLEEERRSEGEIVRMIPFSNSVKANA